MDDSRYIFPVTEVSSTFKEAKEEYGKYGHGFVFDDASPTTISDLTQDKNTIVVGEPGIGKTELMKRIDVEFQSKGFTTKFIPLRSPNSFEEISNFVKKGTKKPKALLLDALDEVPSSHFSDILQEVQNISRQYPNLIIYISSRWVFMERYANVFSKYRFISIKPFTSNQLREYLSSGSRSSADIDVLMQRAMQFHGRIIIQIPRYLFLFEQFMTDKSVTDVQEISRNELFEHFIYSKLRIEAQNNQDIREMEQVLKRLLEKLALTMEIYQANSITRDELVTFFDDVRSDIKLMVLAQVGIDILLKNSLLQISKEDTNSIEFENAEFQEYLAAKELTRFPEPRRATFSFAADETINEFYPSWYNTLSFFVDMDRDILGQLLDFSGIHGQAFKVVDEAFFNFLSRVNPKFIPDTTKERLFIDSVSYHNTKLQWIPGQLTSSLPGFYSSSLESFLKAQTEEAEAFTSNETKYYVPLGNISYVISYLLRAGLEIDITYWRGRLISYASGQSDNGVLPRHALLALAKLGDPTVIDELPDLTNAPDELVMREFVSLCSELDPNKDESVDAFIKLIRSNDLHGRYGLFEVTGLGALKRFLRKYNEDEQLRREFLDDSSIFKDKDHVLVDHIRAVADEEMREIVLEVIVKSLHYSVAHTRGESQFVIGLMHFLREENPDFIPNLIRQIQNSDDGENGLYFAQDLFAEILTPSDVGQYIDMMLEAGLHKMHLMNTLIRIKLRGDEDSDAIYEAGREKLPDSYREYEEARRQPPSDHEHVYDERILSEFRNALEPAPQQYMTRVFHDYNSNVEKLEKLMSDADRERFDTLIRQEVLRHDPAERGLTINSETDGGSSRNYTTSGAAIVFGDALAAAKHRGIDITPYRSNIARFIPFAHSENLKTVFELVPDFSAEELNSVIRIYNDRDSDLWRWQPDSLIEAAEQYNLTAAGQILRDFVRETQFRRYDREQSLSVAELLQPDEGFLKEIFSEYIEGSNDEKAIATKANGLLITKYAKPEAVHWRLEQVQARVAASAIRPRSGVVQDVTPFEDELHFGKEFAKPLMELKSYGFEEKFLDLIDKALEVWALGDGYHPYAQYLWEIVYAYFENLKEYGDYKPLRLLEEKIALVGNKKEGANWLAARMVSLRRSYLNTIGKPSQFAEAVRKYNSAREYDDKRIITSADLARHLHDAIDTDLRRWIEGEGAYELILTGKIYETKKQEYEKLIQKTLKSQIENVMLKRGFHVDLLREPDLLDDKRVDLIIRYGFVGPVILEVKLTSNSDIRSTSVSSSKSYKSLSQYMRGYGADYGIFLIIVNSSIRTLPRIKEEFSKIKGVTPVSIDCTKFVTPKKKVAKKTTKKIAKKKSSKKVTSRRS